MTKLDSDRVCSALVIISDLVPGSAGGGWGTFLGGEDRIAVAGRPVQCGHAKTLISSCRPPPCRGNGCGGPVSDFDFAWTDQNPKQSACIKSDGLFGVEESKQQNHSSLESIRDVDAVNLS